MTVRRLIEPGRNDRGVAVDACRRPSTGCCRRGRAARWSPGSACSCRCRRGRCRCRQRAGEVDDRQIVGAEREGVEGGPDPAEAAVGVDDAGVPEVVEPARSARASRRGRTPARRGSRGGPSTTPGGRPGAACRCARSGPTPILASFGCSRVRSTRSSFLPGSSMILSRSRTVGTRSAEAARKFRKKGPSRSATGFDASTSGSTSSSVARRLTAVVLKFAHEVRQLGERRLQRGPLPRDRVHHPVEVPDQGGEVVAAGGDGLREAGAVDDQLLERRRVAGQLGERAPRGREERVQVLEALVGLRADALVGDREPLDHLLEVGDGLRRRGC